MRSVVASATRLDGTAGLPERPGANVTFVAGFAIQVRRRAIGVAPMKRLVYDVMLPM